MDDIEIPQYFICPISLQIMKDPVTAVTGITYDRQSIEHWLSTAEEGTCPVTNQSLPRDSDLTPNHMLRRLIQAWCVANAKNGIDLIPTPKSPLNNSHVRKLFRDLQTPLLRINALKKIDQLASESEKNRKCFAEAGAAKSMVSFIVRCFKERRTHGLEEAFRVLHLIWSPTSENKQMVIENFDLLKCMVWVLNMEVGNHLHVKIHAVLALKAIIEFVNSSILERLDHNFFIGALTILRDSRFSNQAIKAVVHVLIAICQCGRNQVRIIESGFVFEVMEIELNRNPEKRTSELIFSLLAELCSCADGRAQFLKHAGGIAMVTKRLLRVSPATDDRALHLLALVAKFSATNEVLLEMLRVGAVSKLCMILQADCADYLKKKAREILRLHSNIWNNSPCIQVYLLTRYTR